MSDRRRPRRSRARVTPAQRAIIDKAKEDKAKREKEEAEAAAAKAAKRQEESRAAAAKPAESKRVPDPVQPMTYKQMDERLAADAWGIDSMASVHVSGNRDNFGSLRKCAPVTIKTADGSLITAKQSGTIKIRVQTRKGNGIKFDVPDVYYHPDFTSNLLSGVTLTRRMGWSFINTPEESYLISPNNNEVSLSTKGKITVLLSAGPERVYSSLLPGQAVRDDSPKTAAWLLLHQRLGHMGFDQLVELVRSKRVDGLGDPSLVAADIDAARKVVRECEACVLGKHARTQFDHRGLERGRQPGDIIHMDTYPVSYTGEDGQRRVEHGVAMKDAFSKEAWFARVRTKDQVASVVIDTLKVIERSTGGKVRRLCIDGGTEFVNQTLERYLVGQGILPRVSPPSTQALNGVAESSVRTLKDGARTLLAHAARAPARLWHHAAAHTVWVWNRSRVSRANKMTPYEASSKRLPSLRARHVGVWGCDCFVHQRKELRAGAMAAKSEPGIYLGHDERHNCGIVLLLRTGKKVVSKDLRFFNDRFTHMRAYKEGREAMEAAADGALESDDSPDYDEDKMPALGGLEQPSADRPLSEAEESEEEADGAKEEYEVEEILSAQVRRGVVAKYQVKWVGYAGANLGTRCEHQGVCGAGSV